jgi:NADPH2:quinone reductase
MKALVYEKAHTLDAFAIHQVEEPEPEARPSDVLVEVHAIGINPGETFFRRTQSALPGRRVLLGFEFAGVVVSAGAAVRRLKVGDRVFGMGDVTRDGAWAERVAVDCRVVAKLPDSLSFTDAASLPIGALTAWEALFRDVDELPHHVKRVLIIGGAGGVGSLATQLLKVKTDAFVIASASRPESKAWCETMGADLVVDHSGDVVAQLATANIADVDMVLSTAKTAENIGWISQALRPFGHISSVDGAAGLDASALMGKALSLHMEMVFSRLLHGSAPEAQGAILDSVSSYVAKGKIRPIATTKLVGLTPETMRAAHTQVEKGHSIGKTVITIR